MRRAITPRTRAIVTVTPNNPSGAVFREAALRAVNALCRERGLYHISRRGLRVLHLRRRAARLAGRVRRRGGHTISLYSLSKAYGFAGWRIGYMVVSGASGRRDRESPGHDAGLPAGDRRRWRRSPRCDVGPRVLRAARPRARRGPRHRARRAVGARAARAPCRRPTARSIASCA